MMEDNKKDSGQVGALLSDVLSYLRGTRETEGVSTRDSFNFGALNLKIDSEWNRDPLWLKKPVV